MLEFYFGFSLLVILSVFVFYTNSVVSSGRGLGVQINYIGVYLLGVIAFLYSQSSNASLSYIANSCVKDPITIFFIVLGLLGGVAILALAIPYLQRGSLHEYEFFFVVALTLLGLILVVESNDFLSLYLGIELQSLGLYILATIKNNSTFSTEAGLKYFILGAFASILLLFGIVLFYALTGLLNFDDFLLLTVNNADLPAYYTNGILLSLIFISISLIFKIGGAPFHMWVPDVYEGATSIVTAYFSLVPKLAILSVLLRLTFLFFYGEFVELSNLFIFCSVLSCFIGALGAFGQTRIKRVLSYSAIFHSGLLLFGLSLGNFEAFVGSLFYIVIYFTLVLHIFSTVLGGQNSLNNSILKVTSNFGYLYKSNRFLGISLVIALFSLAGIPPLSGFFSKLFIFFAGIKQGYLLLSIILIMLSAGGATYYLRVIRSAMFFNKKRTWLCFNQISKGNAYVVSFLLLLNISIVWWSSTLLYFIYNNSLIYLF